MSEVTRSETPGDGEPVVPPENQVVDLLIERRWTIAAAESLTAGAVTARLCWCPGTEDRVLGGLVSYSTAAKRRVLGATAEQVVSTEAALEMAQAVRALFGADVGLSLTGVAGPDRQDGQPVGTVFVGWSAPHDEGCLQLSCAGSPEQVRREAAHRSLLALIDVLGAAAPRPGERLGAPRSG